MSTQHSLLDSYHVFEVRGQKLAFHPVTYDIKILGDEESQNLRRATVCDNHLQSDFLAEDTDIFPLQSLCLLVTSKCNLSCTLVYPFGGQNKVGQVS